MSTDSPTKVLKQIVKIPHEQLTWWNIAVSALAHENHISASEAAHRLSACWPASAAAVAVTASDSPEEILNEFLQLPAHRLTWWNVAVMAFARGTDEDAATASEHLSHCWGESGEEVPEPYYYDTQY